LILKEIQNYLNLYHKNAKEFTPQERRLKGQEHQPQVHPRLQGAQGRQGIGYPLIKRLSTLMSSLTS
jgi:hypothetical protein